MLETGALSGDYLRDLFTLFLVMMGLYLARDPMHGLIGSVLAALSRGFRFASKALLAAKQQILKRNRGARAYHLALGHEADHRREEERFARRLRSELKSLPVVTQSLKTTIDRLEAEHHAPLTPPEPPREWVDAIALVASVGEGREGASQHVLESLRRSFEAARDEAFRLYKEERMAQQKRLGATIGHWRRAGAALERVDEGFSRLTRQAERIDAGDAPGRSRDLGAAMRPSELGAFVVATFLIGGSALTALVQFELLAQPLRDVVGAGTLIGGVPTADLAATVMIGAQIVLAIVLLDAVRMTRLLPGFSHLSDRLRAGLAIGGGAGLLIIAVAGASLAYSRELMIAESQASASLLLGIEAAAARVNRAAVLAHLALGFSLPFVFALTLIAVESCLTGLRIVIGGALVVLCSAGGFACRTAASSSEEAVGIVRDIYDVVIFAPLWAEKRLSTSLGRALISRAATKPGDNLPAPDPMQADHPPTPQDRRAA
jgi:hypothetical protein